MAFKDGPADEGLHAAWNQFCDRVREAGEGVWKDANPGTPLQRADAFRFLTQNLGQAFDLALETKHSAYPLIHPFCTPTRKLGSDAADFSYRQAWIDGAHRYRITGKRGSARFFNIAVQGARIESSSTLHEPFGDTPQANIFGHQLQCADDGSFELYIGGPSRERNWLPTTPESRKLFIREGFDSWDETPSALTIERLDMESPRPLPSADDMITAMGWAGDFLTGMMRDWPEHPYQLSGGVVDPDLPNQFPAERAANTADDAKRGRLVAHMVWRLQPEEALIVSFAAHAGFWMLSLSGVFMNSFDYLYRPVSYTPARTRVDADGMIRLVLTHDDPGYHNWLDTQQFECGNLTYRNLLSQTPAALTTQLVRRSELRDVMPADSITVTPAQRIEQMRERFASIRRRYGL